MLGSALVARLLAQGDDVRALVRSARSRDALLAALACDGVPTDRLRFQFGDITSRASVAAFVSGLDIVYHAAAFVSFNPRRRRRVLDVNAGGTRNLVDALLESPAPPLLLHVSSIAAIGDVAYPAEATEDCWLKDLSRCSCYALSKYLAEIEVWRGVHEGLRAAIINPAVILDMGGGGRGSSALCRQMAYGAPWVTGGCSGFVWKDDVVDAALRVARSGAVGQRFILCPLNMSYRGLFLMLRARVGSDARPRVAPRWLLLAAAFVVEAAAAVVNAEPVINRALVRSGYGRARWRGRPLPGQ